MKEKIKATRAYREAMLADAYRPAVHFAIADDNGTPGDPNGAFFADGVYHLMYLYRNAATNGFHWGHISSIDLLHWRHHPDALMIEEGDEGCFSGGAFLDDDGTAYLTFWKFASKDHGKDSGGICVAYAKSPYDDWTRISPLAVEGDDEVWGTVNIEVDGEIRHVSCADPSNIWKMNGYYYMQTGNLCALDKWGRPEGGDPYYKGDWTDLFRSKDLKKWEYVHRFYENTHAGEDWPDETEDDMCPSFLPLFDAKENGKSVDKYLQLFIAHNKGTQYYVGELKGETFYPEVHGRMSWKDNTYFAPEALIDDKNRHIIWAWLADNMPGDYERFGWSGVYAFPRLVWWEDGQLKMAPADELEKLQYHHETPEIDENGRFAVRNGELFRMKAVIDADDQEKIGFNVRVGSDGCRTAIYYDKAKGAIVFDASESSQELRVEDAAGRSHLRMVEEAPFKLEEGEKLSLDIFVDKSIIEVYANDRQAICRRVFPADPVDAVGVSLIGDKAKVQKLDAWELFPANPY